MSRLASAIVGQCACPALRTAEATSWIIESPLVGIPVSFGIWLMIMSAATPAR